MKKKYLVFGLLATSLYSFGQSDSGFRKRKVSKTTIQALYSHYLQNGNHSAVTGGIGTEELTVYAPGINLTIEPDSSQVYQIETGVDIISSASTDNIDYVVSSASRVDQRSYLNATYTRKFKSHGWSIGGSFRFSIESDYTSLGFGARIGHISKNLRNQLSVSMDLFLDDLRWGRLSKGFFHPKMLIYPEELRFKEWYEHYRRNSLNLEFEMNQTLNNRNSLTIYTGFSYQDGLLATPFHRVYFYNDSIHKVEQLPYQRLRFPIGFQLNSFLGNRSSLHTYYRFYIDDWGITAHTFRLESPFRLSAFLSLVPSFRFYTQNSSRYFKPYRGHHTSDKFYTSDYDYSGFNSYEPGMELRWAPFRKMRRNLYFDEMSFRYSFYHRSDGLWAHLFSFLVQTSFLKNR